LAREVTLWHYQWLMVNEHLPQIAGQGVVNDVLAHGNRFFRPPAGDAFIPIEFGAAAYRSGHSMVRPSYRANFTSGGGDSRSATADPFFALVFDMNEPSFSDPVAYDRDDLLGGYPAPRRYIGWQTFFDLGDGIVKNNKKIDTTISSVLFTLEAKVMAGGLNLGPVGGRIVTETLLGLLARRPDQLSQRLSGVQAVPGDRFGARPEPRLEHRAAPA
jgi:hypothetical protein